jgi:hypothetical protein
MNCSVTVVECRDTAENTNSAVANNKADDLEWVDRNWHMYRVNNSTSPAHNWQRRKLEENRKHSFLKFDVYYICKKENNNFNLIE